MSSSYHEWENDLTSIIEKTNSNLEKLRNIGEQHEHSQRRHHHSHRSKRVPHLPKSSASVTSNEDNGSGNSSESGSYVSVARSTASGLPPRIRSDSNTSANSFAAPHAAVGQSRHVSSHRTPHLARASSDMDHGRYDSRDETDSLRGYTRTPSVASNSSAVSMPIRVGSSSPTKQSTSTYMADEIRQSLEVKLQAKTNAFEKKLESFRGDLSAVTSETRAAAHKIDTLQQHVREQISDVKRAADASVRTVERMAATPPPPPISDAELNELRNGLSANQCSIQRLERQSGQLVAWKAGVEEDMDDLRVKVKTFVSAVPRIRQLEAEMGDLSETVERQADMNGALDKLDKKTTMLQRQQEGFVDMKAIKTLLQVRLTKDLNALEERLEEQMNELKTQVTASMSAKAASSSKSDMKEEIMEEVKALIASTLKRSDLTPLQHEQATLKEDMSQLHATVERHGRKVQDARDYTLQAHEEVSELRNNMKNLQNEQSKSTIQLQKELNALTSNVKEQESRTEELVIQATSAAKEAEGAANKLQQEMTAVHTQLHELSSAPAANESSDDTSDRLKAQLDKLVAQLEAMEHSKQELASQYAKKEARLQLQLHELRDKYEDQENQRMKQQVDLTNRIRDESNQLGKVQGKAAILETSLKRERDALSFQYEESRAMKEELRSLRLKARKAQQEATASITSLASELSDKQAESTSLSLKLSQRQKEVATLLESSKVDLLALNQSKRAKELEVQLVEMKLTYAQEALQTAANENAGAKEEKDAKEQVEKMLQTTQQDLAIAREQLLDSSERFEKAQEEQKILLNETVRSLSQSYEEHIQSLSSEIEEKSKELVTLQSSLVDKAQLEEVEREIFSLQEQNKRLLTDMTNLQSQLEESSEYEQLMYDAKTEVEKRLMELEEARQVISITRYNVHELEEEATALRFEHEQQVSTLQNEISEARAKMNAIAAQLADLEATKSKLEAEVKELESKVKEGEDSREAYAQETSAMQEQLSTLEGQLEDIQSQLKVKEQELADARCLDDKHRQQLLHIRSAQQEMEVKYQHEVQTLNERLLQETQTSSHREEEVSAMQEQLESIRSEVNEKDEAHTSFLQELSNAKEALQVSHAKETALRTLLTTLTTEVSGVEEDTDESRVEAVRASHIKVLTDLKVAQAKHEDAISQVRADATKIERLNERVATYEMHSQDLEQFVGKLKTQLKDMTMSSTASSQQLKEEICRLQDAKENLEDQVKKISKQLQTEEDALKGTISAKEAQIKELTDANDALEARIFEVQNSLECLENKRTKELDRMALHIDTVETHAEDLELRMREHAPEMTQQELMAARQEGLLVSNEVQNLLLQLTRACGVEEWSALRAQIYGKEEQMDELLAEAEKEREEWISAEEQVLTSIEFLHALKACVGKGRNNRTSRLEDWYRNSAPLIISRLTKLQQRMYDAVTFTIDDMASETASSEPEAVEKQETPTYEE